MSRRGRRRESASAVTTALALSLAGSTLGPPPAAAAQQVGGLSEEALVTRVEALRPALEEARATAEAAEARRILEEERAPRHPTRVLRVGPMRIVTTAERESLARALFDEVWRGDFGALTGSPALEEEVFVFRWTWRRHERLRPDREAAGSGPLRRVELTRAWVRTRAGAAHHVRNAIWSALMRDLPDGTPLKAWLGPAPYPSASRVARGLIQVPTEATRACLAGDLVACTGELGLAGAPSPLTSEARSLALLVAVRSGGVGAWERLVEARESPPLEALAFAAQSAEQDVVAAWRSTVLAARPEVHANLGGQVGRSLLWILLLVALAARSTRWRLA